MMTANEARVATIDRLAVMAKEFIINNTGIPIQDAINNGYFHATVSFEGVPNPEKVGAEVVRQLKEQGFEAEHICYDNINGYANYILIKWEDD
jgi:hypothetical protein